MFLCLRLFLSWIWIAPNPQSSQLSALILANGWLCPLRLRVWWWICLSVDEDDENLGGLFWWALPRIKKLTIRVAAETNASSATLIIVQAAAATACMCRCHWVPRRSIKVKQLALINDVSVAESGHRHSWQRTKRRKAVSSAAAQRLWPTAGSTASLKLPPVSSHWSRSSPV